MNEECTITYCTYPSMKTMHYCFLVKRLSRNINPMKCGQNLANFHCLPVFNKIAAHLGHGLTPETKHSCLLFVNGLSTFIFILPFLSNSDSSMKEEETKEKIWMLLFYLTLINTYHISYNRTFEPWFCIFVPKIEKYLLRDFIAK